MKLRRRLGRRSGHACGGSWLFGPANHAPNQIRRYSYCKVSQSEIVVVWKIKILARDVSDSTPIRRKMRGADLISLQRTAIERCSGVRFNVYNVCISR